MILLSNVLVGCGWLTIVHGVYNGLSGDVTGGPLLVGSGVIFVVVGQVGRSIDWE